MLAVKDHTASQSMVTGTGLGSARDGSVQDAELWGGSLDNSVVLDRGGGVVGL
jgi:hypothetical protein